MKVCCHVCGLGVGDGGEPVSVEYLRSIDVSGPRKPEKAPPHIMRIDKAWVTVVICSRSCLEEFRRKRMEEANQEDEWNHEKDPFYIREYYLNDLMLGYSTYSTMRDRVWKQ